MVARSPMTPAKYVTSSGGFSLSKPAMPWRSTIGYGGRSSSGGGLGGASGRDPNQLGGASGDAGEAGASGRPNGRPPPLSVAVVDAELPHATTHPRATTASE